MRVCSATCKQSGDRCSAGLQYKKTASKKLQKVKEMNRNVATFIANLLKAIRCFQCVGIRARSYTFSPHRSTVQSSRVYRSRSVGTTSATVQRTASSHLPMTSCLPYNCPTAARSPDSSSRNTTGYSGYKS